MLKTVVMVLQIIAALVLIATVLLQSGKSAGLSGSISGGAEAFFGKKKGMDEFFAKVSTIAAITFFVLTLLISIL